jgi:hypothetical protein
MPQKIGKIGQAVFLDPIHIRHPKATTPPLASMSTAISLNPFVIEPPKLDRFIRSELPAF